MPGTLDSVIIIDLEATCWEENPPPGEISDIIEVGIAEVALKGLKLVASESILVKPARSRVSEFCFKLTSITQEMLDKDGVALAEACRILQSKYKSRDRTWVSFGDYDRNKFEKDCRDMNVKYPMGPRHLNIKNFAAQALGFHKEKGMSETLDIMGMKLEGTHHRGGDDANNIAKIYISLMRALRSRLAVEGSPIIGPRKDHGG